MIKRILFAFVLLATPLLALADGGNNALLLTNDGTLYSVDSAFTDEMGIQSPAAQVLVLTVRNDQRSSTAIVPETLLGGSNSNPALAFDPASNSLFIFWQRALNNGMSSDLVFCAYSNGKWSEATSVNFAKYHYAHNIQIAVTRKIDQVDAKGDHASVNGLTVHAVWWEETGRTEWARYAILGIDNGVLTSSQIWDLTSFSDVSRETTGPTDKDFNDEILRHPVVFESSTHDTVDIIYGDTTTNNLHRLTVKPTIKLAASEGRLRIPVGVRDTSIGAPHFLAESTSQIHGMSGDNGRLVLYASSKTSVEYVINENGWSPSHTLPVNDKISTEGAVDLLRRMIDTN